MLENGRIVISYSQKMFRQENRKKKFLFYVQIQLIQKSLLNVAPCLLEEELCCWELGGGKDMTTNIRFISSQFQRPAVCETVQVYRKKFS